MKVSSRIDPQIANHSVEDMSASMERHQTPIGPQVLRRLHRDGMTTDGFVLNPTRGLKHVTDIEPHLFDKLDAECGQSNLLADRFPRFRCEQPRFQLPTGWAVTLIPEFSGLVQFRCRSVYLLPILLCLAAVP